MSLAVEIALIANAKKPGAAQELRVAVHALRDQGHRVHARLTFEATDAIRFARLATRRRVDLVIAAGGDGTVNEVVNGMMAARLPRPRLGVVPLGTANDFAKGLQIPLDIHEAMAVALQGSAVEVDVAAVNERCFVNVSTGGFGPEITEAVSAKAKRLFGKLAYLFSAVRQLAQLEPAHAVFESEGRTVYEGPFFFFAVGNARHTGGGTPVTPRADYSDAQLDVVIVTGNKRRNFLTLLPDIRAGEHMRDPDVLYLQSANLHIRPIDSFAVNADGEPIDGPDFAYRVLAETISVMRS